MSRPTAAPGWWRAAAALVFVGTAASGVAFALLDPRPAPDLNRSHEALPLLAGWLATPGAPLRGLAPALMRAGGLYDLLLAGLLSLPLPGRQVYALLGVAWLLLLLAGTGRLARTLAGPARADAAAAAALALAAAAPLSIGGARLGWVHLPEAALLLWLASAWAADRALARWTTVATVAVGGAFALALRPSALPWLLLFVIAAGSGLPARADRRRLAAALLPWGFGLPALASSLPAYLAQKLAARPRYAELVADIGAQLRAEVGAVPLLLALLGAGLALGRHRRGADGRVVALLLSWVLVAGLLTWVFAVGIDNFTLAWPALCVLAAVGLARSRPLAFASVALWAVLTAASWLPASMAEVLLRPLPGSPAGFADDHPGNPLRVYHRFGAPHVDALLDASCPTRATTGCRVAVDHGLFRATAEEPGRFELALLGEDRVVVDDLARRAATAPVDALARFRCRAEEPAWRRRHPDAASRAGALVDDQQLALAWAVDLDHHCRFEWWTPGAMLAVPLGPLPGTP